MSFKSFSAIAAVWAFLLLAAGPAGADTIHPFLGDITLPAGAEEANVLAVDHDGNLLVWLDEKSALAKFDANGSPVNFSALGTNVIDGKGSGNCPAILADCDQVPTNGFVDQTIYSGGVLAAVDNSGGPADGYIYIENRLSPQYLDEHNITRLNSEVDVFNEAGEFLGSIDTSPSKPIPPGSLRQTTGVAVSPNGTVILSEYTGFASTNAVMYVPVDGNPAHDQFAGQFFSPCADTSCQGAKFHFRNSILSESFLYTQGNYYEKNSWWVKIPIGESHHPRFDEPSAPVNIEPDNLVFGNGGSFLYGLVYETAMLDPVMNDVYIGLAGEGYGNIQQWTESNHKVGPNFGEGHIGYAFGSILTMAMDRSGGPNDGHIYARGVSPSGNKVAVFGNPVHIPDLTNTQAVPDHNSAHISLDVDLDSGPQVDSCTVEYGFDTNYGFSKPCSPPTPYSGHTEIAVDLTGLFVEETYHFKVIAHTSNGSAVLPDRAFRTAAVLGLKTEGASGLTKTEANLNGSFEPDGLSTTYRYEYGADTNYTESTPVRSVPTGSGAVQLPPELVTGLQGGRKYHYRLVATNELGTTYGEDKTVIVPAAPSISGVTASEILAESAKLNGHINNFDSPATYRFEYGTSPSYGNSTSDFPLPASDAVEPVSFVLANLQPGVTYHFRLVATSGWGTTRSADSTVDFLPPNCPNSHIRQLTSGNYLPDCRAYELVSPSTAGNVSLFPGGVTVDFGTGFFKGDPRFSVGPTNPLGLASSPPRFAFYGGEGSITGLHPPNDLIDRYVSTRTNDGWVTTYPGRKGDEATLATRASCSVDMSVCLDYRPKDELNFSSEPIPGSEAPYIWDVSGESLGRWPTNLGAVIDGEKLVGDTRPSPDFSHFFFSSRDQAFAPGAIVGTPGSAYDNAIGDGTVTVISRLSNGDPIPQDPLNTGDETNFIRFLGTSMNGSHVLMAPPSQPACPENQYCSLLNLHLFMRVDDAVTYDVSQGAHVDFLGMTRSGSRVLFLTDAQLSSADTDSSDDIYMWDEEHPIEPVVVTQGNGNGNTDSCNAGWTSACDVKTIEPERPLIDNTFAPGNGDPYFYSPEQLDPENPGIHNQRNLYVFRHGQVHYVTTLDAGTDVDRIQISPDDSHMAFLTRSQVTQYDNEGWEEMYTWEPESGEIRCASCIPSGEPPTIAYKEPCFQCTAMLKDVSASESGLFMTNDGRVGFSTADALLPGDTNRTIDVYEFSGDRPRLVSAGTGNQVRQGGRLFYPGLDTGFEGFSADGIDMFFSTFDTLVPQDRNGSFVKFYDARTNGGFPATPPPLPCTAADECHGDSSIAPNLPTVGTGARLGTGGNTQGTSRKRKRGKRPRRRHAHSNNRGGRRHG